MYNNKFKNLKKSLIAKTKLSLWIGFLFVLCLFLYSPQVQGSALQKLSGFAWGADNWSDINKDGKQDPAMEVMNPSGGIGWVSFNCVTQGAGGCSGNDYGVDIDTNGNLIGYAWSPSYGWLKFGGLSGFPSGPGTTSDNAKVDLTTGKVSGWARFCAAADNPTTCLGTNNFNDNKRGGWDGWLSLRGLNEKLVANSEYGLVFQTTDGTLNTPGTLTGFAWGGDDGGKNVVGWVKFTDVKYDLGPAVAISANPQNVPTGGSTQITWVGTNLITSPSGCHTSGSPNTGPNWYNAGSGTDQKSPNGDFNTGVLPNGVYTYSIQCLGSDGKTMSNLASVEVTVGNSAVLNFYAEPSTVYPPLYSTTLKWQVLNSNSPLTNCQAESIPATNWSGAVANAPVAPQIATEGPINVPVSPTKFKLTCSDAYGNPISSEISVSIGSVEESLTLQATASVGNPVFGYTSTLSWSGKNIAIGSCNATLGGPNWPGVKAGPPGTQNGVIVPMTAPNLTTYRLTCKGEYSGGDYTAEIKLNEGSKGTFNTVKPKYYEN